MAMTKNTAQRSLFPFPAMLPATMLLVATASCVADAGLDPALLGDVDLTPVTAAGDQWNSCTTWDCGKNHPMVNLLEEIYERKSPNVEGFQVTGLTRFGVPLSLEVENGEMRVYNAAISHTGPWVLGSIMTVADEELGETWEIEIYNMTSLGLPYWAGGGVRKAYHLRYRMFGSTRPFQNLCNAPLEPSDDPLWPDGFETYAILIDDERYDRDGKFAYTDGAEGWFNIACAGSTLAKMVLMHYDPNVPATDPIQTSPDERTTVIRMLTGAYTEGGESFTEAGKELIWADARGLFPAPEGAVSEAVWDQTGAVCLDQPRLGVAILPAIQATCLAPAPDCPIPTCAEKGITDDNWTQHGLWRTWIP